MCKAFLCHSLPVILPFQKLGCLILQTGIDHFVLIHYYNLKYSLVYIANIFTALSYSSSYLPNEIQSCTFKEINLLPPCNIMETYIDI